MASIASLVISLSANTAKFETDMQRATRRQTARVKEMERQMALAGKAIGVAFVAAAAGMTALVVKTTRTADEMAKMGRRLGASTESLSELSHVANLSGVEFRTLEMGLQRMTRRIGEVAFLGKGEAKVALETLGLSAKKLAELPLDKQFEAIAEELSQVANVSQRTSLAMKIFDAEGVKLVQLMEDGAGGIQAMREEANRLGLTIGGELAANSERFNNNMVRLQAGFAGATNVMTQAMLPALIQVQEYFLNSGNASNFAADAGEFLGKVLRTLVAAFIVVKNAAIAFGKVLVGLADLIFNSFKAILSPITGAVTALVEAFDALKEGDVTKAMQALGKTGQMVGKDWAEAQKKVEQAAGFIVDDAIGGLTDGLAEAAKVMTATDKAAKPLPPQLKKVGGEFKNLGSEAESAADAANEFNKAIQDVMDDLFPVETLARDFEATLRMLEEASRQNTDQTELYAEVIRRLKENYGEAVRAAVGWAEETTAATEDVTESVNMMNTAIDEGVRIIERAFTDMWSNLLSGAENSFDAIADGFRNLMASLIHQATTGKIVLNIQQGLAGQGTGPGGGINFGQLGSDLLQFGAIIAGSALAGGGTWATFGSVAGAVAGQALGQSMGWWLGSWGGPIGMFVGSALGGLLGKFLGKLFGDDSFRATLGGVNAPGAGSAYGGFDTALGRVLGIASKNFGHFTEGDKPGGQVAEAITAFDQQIADIIGGLAGTEQLQIVKDALADWTGTWEEGALTIENVLGSRWQTILSAFEEDIRTFTMAGAGLEKQVERFAVGLAAAGIIDDNPLLFANKSVADFLAVVEDFASGTMTMTQAMDEVIRLIEVVGTVLQSLQDFAGSDLASSYQGLVSGQNISLTEALAGMNQGLMDAVANFDGSIESLQEIGQIAMLVREGELKLLAQIDSIAQGLNATLDSLEADIRGIGQPDATGEQIFNRAAALIGQVAGAQSPEEIAAIGQEFDALIRSLSEADQIANQSELLRMIEVFRGTAADNLAAQRQQVLDNATETRNMLDGFLTRIGDTLDVIAGSNERTALALEGGEPASMDDGVDLGTIIDDGMTDITNTVGTIGPQVANAIRQGFNGVNVQVVVQGGGLVTE